MSAPFEHRLEGCAPVPLASYLKALGVFRLVAEQADEKAAACWRDERLILRTRLSREELTDFFLREYKPAPILSPWNAGSGFYYREGKGAEKDASGKKIKTGVRDEATTATRTLDALVASTAERFAPLRSAALAAKARLAEEQLSAAPSDEGKAKLVATARSMLPESAMAWIDAAATLVTDGLAYPPLLGSGGNDGNLDFSTTFFQALGELLEVKDGEPRLGAGAALGAALFGQAHPASTASAISQFASADSGGLNAGTGFEGASNGNRWDVVLGLEGALMLSSSTARRLGAANESGGAFPFMTPRGGALAAGGGGLGVGDESTARGEFWAPTWSRLAGLPELAALFREGRAVVHRRGVRNSVDFARAVAQLGVARGLDHFDRHAFEQRNGNMYVGLSLPRRHVLKDPAPDLIADLDRGRWLDAARSVLRDKGGSAALSSTARQLDDALFRLAGDASPGAVQAALIAIGRVALECGRRPKLRSSEPGRRTLTPPPRLSQMWRERAGDGSAELALAAALAGTTTSTVDGETMPFRAHLAPLEVGRRGRADRWAEGTAAEALVVWTGRDLVRDLAAVLERRLIEAQRTTFLRGQAGPPELPLRSIHPAPLWAVADFLAEDVDADRVAELAAGLAWVGPGESDARKSHAPHPEDRNALPLIYTLIKPLLDPAGVGPDEQRRLVDPLPVIRMLMAGNVEAAVRRAQLTARGAGLPTPYRDQRLSAPGSGDRLVAALAFPIFEWRKLIERAYPDLSKEDSAYAH